MAKKTYTVLAPLSHDGKDYAPGKSVDMDEDQAAILIEQKVVEPKADEKPAGKK